MNDTPTPRTDEQERSFDSGMSNVIDYVHANFARTLERELAEAIAERDALRAQVAATTGK